MLSQVSESHPDGLSCRQHHLAFHDELNSLLNGHSMDLDQLFVVLSPRLEVLNGIYRKERDEQIGDPAKWEIRLTLLTRFCLSIRSNNRTISVRVCLGETRRAWNAWQRAG